MSRRLSAPSIAVVVLGWTVAASAQTTAVFIQGGGALTTQTSDTSPAGNPSYGTPGVGGTAFGVVAGLGIRLNAVAGVTTELSLPARFETVQEMHHFLNERIDNLYRDTIISELVHVRLSRHRMGPEIAAGLSVVHQSIKVRYADGGTDFNPKPYGPYGDWIEQSETTWGMTFGADVPIRVADRFDIVPQMRVHVIPSRSELSGLGDLRLSAFVFRPGVGCRWTF